MPLPSGSTLLHVVYAGRGDAFYLEYTYRDGTGLEEHVLVPLDGGPLKSAVKLKHSAPYRKYYLAVGEHIWKESFAGPDNLRFGPKAIINSHPHDDHLDGLLYLMNNQWADAMSFNGPFILPNQACNGKIEVEAMAQNLNFTPSFGCQVPGINFYYPSPNAEDRQILSFNHNPLLANTNTGAITTQTPQLGDRPVITLPDKISIDTSSENIKSILMDIDPDQTKGKGRMFFTGDSVGHKIWDYVNGKHFSVYKIQHHGSLRNTQFDDTIETVNIRVAQEAALYALLSFALKGVPDALFINPPRDEDRKLLKQFIQNCLNEKEQFVLAGYLDELKSRNKEYLEQCAMREKRQMIQLRPIPWKPQDKELQNTRKPYEIWTLIVLNIRLAEPVDGKPFDKTYGPLFYLPYRDEGIITRTRHYEQQLWVASLLDVKKFQNNFKAVLLTGSIFQFFETFTADAYVVSANKKHRHPSASTIAGLAIAVHNRKPDRPVPLYATSGYSIDMNEVIAHVKEMGFRPAEVFNDRSLVIRCLDKGVYMTINGNGGVMAPGPDESHDVLGVTRAFPLEGDATIDLKAIHKKFEKSSGLLPDRQIGRGRSYRYQITAPVQENITRRTYMTLNQHNGAVFLTDVQPENPFIVMNSWSLDAPTFEYYLVTQTYEPANAQATLRIGRRKVDGITLWQIGFWNGLNWVRHYVQTDGIFGQIGWDEGNPMDATSVYFHLRDVTPLDTLMGQQPSAITSLVALPPAPPVAAARTGTTLAEFCIAAGIDAQPPFSALRALQAILGVQNLSALGVIDGFEKFVLPYPTDLASAVDFTDNGLDMEVHSASLALSPPPGAVIDVAGEMQKISSVAITLQWPLIEDLSVVTTVNTDDGMEVMRKRKLAATALPISLKKTLATMGVDATTMEKIGAPNAVAYLTADQAGLAKLFYERVPVSLLTAGLMDLKPDLELSTVEAWYDATGLPAVKRARVVCLTPADTWKSLFNLGGIEITLGEIGILMEDALLPSQTISLYGSAMFKTSLPQENGVKLALSCQLNMDGDVQIDFSISGTDSLDTLSSLLKSDSGLTNAQVPFRNGPLSTLASTSKLAITFTQSTNHLADYRLSKISASTRFSDWKDFLPAEFPINNLVSVTDVGIALEILNPLDSVQRAVGASVALQFRVGSDKTTQKIVRLGFAANPLGSFGDYEYRLAAFASDSGLSIADIATAIGITGVEEALTAAGSLVSQLLTEVRIRCFSVAVEKRDDVWKFTDWSLDVGIDRFVIIQDVFSLSNVSVSLENSNGLLMGDLSGSIQIATISLQCKLTLPTKSRPGLISIESPNGVSATDIISALKLPDVSSIPVLGTLLSTQLETAHFTIGYLPNQGGGSSLSWLGSSFTFELDEVSVTDALVIDGISVSIGYHSEHDPFGPGKTQFVFLLKAAFLDNALAAEIIYDSLASEIEFALTSPDPTKTAKISDMVGKLLGSSFQYALEPLVRDFAIKEASLKLSTAGDIQVQHFKIDISDGASAEFQGLTMKSLSVEYTAAQTAKGDKPAVPEKFVLQGSIQKGKVGARLTIECTSSDGENPTQVAFVLDAPSGTNLYLSGLVDLFALSDPSYDKPDQCPDFTGLVIKTIQGKVSLQTDTQTGKRSLSLDSLDAHIESLGSIEILKDPAVTLTTISLRLHYENKVFSGQVYGHLAIETVDIWAYFKKDEQGSSVFEGRLSLNDQQAPVAFDKLAATFLPDVTDYNIPSILNAPREIPLFVFGVKLIPDKSIEVWGTGQLPLSLDASGYTVSMAKIGGMVRRIKGSDLLGLPDQYTAFLIGELQFNTFTSARASVTLGTGRATMLTASITSQSPAIDLDGLTVPLSGDGSTLKTISPTGTSNLDFGSSGYLCVDFTNSKLFLFGQLAPPISAYGMIMGQWKPSGTVSDRRYFVSVTTQNMGQIWSELNVPVLSAFQFSLAGGQIVSWTGTVEELHTELSAFVAAAQYAKVDVTDVSSTLLALPQADPVPRGGALFATLDLKRGGAVNDAIATGLEPTMPDPTLTLYATLNKDDPKQSKFMVSMQNMYLFGGALLFNGTAEYHPDGKRLMALGSMQLTLSTASSVSLQMELDVSENLTSFKLQGKPSTDDTLVNPFVDMFNVQLKELVLTGSIRKSEKGTISDYSLSGSVYLGAGILRADLTGGIYFSQGKAVTANLALVTGQQGVSVEDVFSSIIQPGDTSSGSWPSGYGTISFQSASIYYSIQEYRLGKQVFKKGYHIAADILIFGTLFSITADLGNRKGIVITGQKTDPIDLGFLRLSGRTPTPPTPPPTPPAPASGPSVTIDTTGSSVSPPYYRQNFMTANDVANISKTVYKAEVGVQLFDLPQLDATFQYQQGEASLKCIVQYTGTFLGVANPQITIFYKEGKFSLGDWQMMEDMLDKVDVAKAIGEASKSDTSACKKLVGLIFDKTINTKFNFTVGDASVKDGSLKFNLKWTYDITIIIPGAPDIHIAGLKLPNFPLTISPPFELSELHRLLVNSILASIEDIGAALLHPDNVTQFLTLIAVMKAKEWTKDLIEGLVCRKVNTENVKERGEDIADENANEMEKPDNPGNKATEWARTAISATSLATALGGLATAVQFGLEFGLFLDGAVGLLSALISAFDDTKKLEELKKKAEGKGEKAESSIQDAKDFVGKVLNLSVTPNPPVSSYVPSETYESTIDLNWEVNKPNWPGFDYGNFEKVVWEVRMGLVDNVDDPSMHDLTSDSFSLTYSDPSFAFGSTVYSYIRARATVQEKPYYSANWTRAQPAVHVPWIHPVPQVEFQVSAVKPFTCTASIPDADAGKYHFQIVGTDSSSTTVLYEVESVVTSPGMISLDIDVYKFSPANSVIAACLARVKAVSPDPNTSHDSPYTESPILTAVAAPSNLYAKYIEEAVVVSWDQPGSSTDDFDLLVVQKDGRLDTTVTSRSISAPDGQRQASLTGPSIIRGAKFTIAARAKPPSADSLGLFALLTYQVPQALLPTPQIDSESFYDIETQELHMTVKFVSPPPPDMQFVLQVHPSTGPLPDPIKAMPRGAPGSTIVSFGGAFDIGTARTTTSITVASLDPLSGEQGDFSEPWKFPIIPQSLPACKPSATFTSAGSVQVSWSWDGLAEPTAQRVKMIVRVPKTTLALTHTVQRPDTVTIFTMEQSDNLFKPGQKVTFECTSMAPSLAGGLARIDFTIPGSNGWTPYAVVNGFPVGPLCIMASISRSGSNSIQLWWTSPDGSIQTALQQNNSWIGSRFMGPSTVPNSGSCLTGTTRNNFHQEIWWITENGAIDGKFWLQDGLGWRSPDSDSYPFNKRDQASTKAGGSMTCMSRPGSRMRMDVWWVTPNGGIGNARWNSSDGWRDVFNAAPSGTVGFGSSISGLTAQSLDGKTVDVFYIYEGGGIGGVHSHDPDAVTEYFLYKLTPVMAARVDGGFTSIQLSPQQIALFWISYRGSVDMFVLTRNYSDVAGWDRRRLALTENGSASETSGIAALSTGNNKFSVWWNGPSADLRRIDVDLTKEPGQWPVYEQLGAGSCRKTRTLLLGSIDKNQRHLWYVGSTSTMQGMFSGS
ncbi:hypothetical protein Neosp_001377 [[Neocosmospora] mangrovei]